MKKQIFVLMVVALSIGCKKYEQKALPVSATYVLKGYIDTIYDNGFVEGVQGPNTTNHRFIIISGRRGYGWSPNHDTLFKDLWTGDKLSIKSATFTAIYYQTNSASGYLVDSSDNHIASITIGSNY